MPKIEVLRKGVTPAARPVPTDTTLTVLPMTLGKVGKELTEEDVDNEPTRIDSVDEAFKQFQPSHRFETYAGEESTEFVADLDFRSLKDFSPENIQKKAPGKRNDIADLKTTIDLLYRLKDRWALPGVKKAWNDPSQRQQILGALTKLRAELEKVAQPKGAE